MNKPIIHKVGGYSILFMKSKSKTVYVSSIVANGYCNEKQSEIGINHLLEHVLIESWKKCKQKSCDLYWMTKPVFYNGFTTMTQMKYFIDGDSVELPNMLDYIIEITTHPKILQKKLNAEKKIVINEMDMRINMSNYNFNQITLNELYTIPGFQQSNNYLLQKKNVENISLSDLSSYMQKYYTPSNTFFFVSGDFDPAHVLSVFRQKLPNASPPPLTSGIPTKNPFSYKSNLLFVTNKTDEAKHGGVDFSIYFPIDIHINNDLLLHLLVACNLLQTELYNILRGDHKLIYSMSVQYATYYYGTVVEITGSCLDSNLILILKYIIAHIRQKKTKNIDQKLLNNAKKLLLLDRYNNIKNPMEIAEFYESQYLLNQMQDRYRSRGGEQTQQEPSSRIYSEKEIDENIKTINANHVRKIINMLDFHSVIIGYTGKKNLNLKLSNFVKCV